MWAGLLNEAKQSEKDDHGADAMTIERNKELVRRMVEEGTNGITFDALDEVIAPDAVDHTGPPGQRP